MSNLVYAPLQVVMTGNQEPKSVDITQAAMDTSAEELSRRVTAAMRDSHLKSVAVSTAARSSIYSFVGKLTQLPRCSTHLVPSQPSHEAPTCLPKVLWIKKVPVISGLKFFCGVQVSRCSHCCSCRVIHHLQIQAFEPFAY